MMNPRKYLLAAALLVPLFFGATTQARAQSATRVLVGFPPGGGSDNLARLFAEKLAEATGRPFVVENRTGATGRIAIMALKGSTPDGNTLLVTSNNPLTMAPHTLKTVGYDTLRDFAPIAHLGGFHLGLAVNTSVPTTSLKDWLGWAKAGQKNAVIGTAGPILVFMLAQEIGVPLEEVMYRGMAPLATDLVGGHVRSAVASLDVLVPHVSSGKIRILAHVGTQRSPFAPEVPTFRELGYPELEILSGWFVLVGPAGIRPELVTRYNEIVNQAMRTQSVKDRLKALYIESTEMAPAPLAALMKSEYERRGVIVKASGFVPE
jgi:tripartite-type tricarboxylate transporter receptor subunit TctC